MAINSVGLEVFSTMLREYLEPHRGVWEVFKENGFKAYFVGGCVRDALLSRSAKDIDITTDANPDDIKRLFDNHYDIGEKFGSLIVDYNNSYYDITTLRTEDGYSNFRHPEILEYTSDIKLDLKRRDFTVNAMAFNFDEGHIDLFGGVTDLSKKSIKVVGDADKRFREDALRMLRAIRFSCELGFSIERGTLEAIKKDSRGIKYVSKERIYSEIKRAVSGDFLENIIYLKQTGLGKMIHPIFKSLNYNNIPKQKDYILRLSHILRKKDIAMTVLGYLKAEKVTLLNVIRVLDGVSAKFSNSLYKIRKLISSAGEANAKRVLILKEMNLEKYEKILKDKDCISLSDLAVDGNDLITTGIEYEGIDIRHILNKLLDEVMKDPSKNKFEILLPMARELKTHL
ncbi:MAG: hypothetical protein KAH14_02250 [Clostridiales bacterium]|nr:hypothetical protein [Clostridiales bacterium]